MLRPLFSVGQAGAFPPASLQPQSDYTLVTVNVYKGSDAESCRNDPVDFTDPLGLTENVVQAFQLGDKETPAYQFSGSGSWSDPTAYRSLEMSHQEMAWKLVYEPTLKISGTAAKIEAGVSLTLSGHGWIVAAYGGWMAANGLDEAQSLIRNDSTLLDKAVTRIGDDPLIVNVVNDAGQIAVGVTAGLKATEPSQAPVAKNVSKGVQIVEDLVGPNAKATVNEAGDLIIESDNGLTKVRIDINKTVPHKNPHAHVEVFEHIKNRKVPVQRSGPIYPKDVPHE